MKIRLRIKNKQPKHIIPRNRKKK